MTVVHPIARAWISTGGTGARNYDEFADEAEITEIVRANPGSALAVEMPHRAPDSLGKSFANALPDAVARLTRQQEDGTYAPAESVVVLYRNAPPGGAGAPVYGIFGMVDTDQISASVDEPGLVIRNEDVNIDKVRERADLAAMTGHLLSSLLLLQTGCGDELSDAIAAAVHAAGAPAVADVDHAGRTHAVWPIPGSSATAVELLRLASGGEIVVADGNHRSLAAQIGGLRRFLAIVTAPGSVTIDPYHRLVSDLPDRPDKLLYKLEEAGATIELVEGPPGIPPQGTIYLYSNGSTYGVVLPELKTDHSIVDSMDHAQVENLLLRDVLGLEPDDKRIKYVGGDYPPQWLVDEVDAGRAELAVLIAPIAVEQFVAVNLARLKLPRKSTWFTPKARAGLVVADLAAEV